MYCHSTGSVDDELEADDRTIFVDDVIVLDLEEESSQQDDQAIVLSEESNSDRESENDLEGHNTSGNDDVAVDTISHLLWSTRSEIANSSDLPTCDAQQSASAGDDQTQLAIQDAISSGDFGKIAQLKSQINLTDQQKYFLLKRLLSTTNFPLM